MLTLNFIVLWLFCSASALISIAFVVHSVCPSMEGATNLYAKVGIGLLMAAVFLFLVSFIP